jgi:hypothetical protein
MMKNASIWRPAKRADDEPQQDSSYGFLGRGYRGGRDRFDLVVSRHVTGSLRPLGFRITKTPFF